METLSLVKPHVDLEPEFLDLARELCAAEGPQGGCLARTIRKYEEADRDFAAFVAALAQEERGEALAPGTVPQTTFWLSRDDGRLLGESRLRHRLNEFLAQQGGHIGYAIRPSERRKRYGAHILALTLDEARRIGLTRVLLTCDKDNIASQRIILANGGLLDSEGISARSGKPMLRYWIGV
jgi:predicted acetyltransferase